MELRLAASKELRGDAFAGESAFLLAKALASLACSRSFARLVDDARESVVTNRRLVSCWSCLYAGNPVCPSPPSPSFILRRIITHSPELVTFGLAVVVVVVVVAVVAVVEAAAPAVAAGGVALRSSSDSARMLSKRDSTPATACCRNEPHRDACFPGALMVLQTRKKKRREPVELLRCSVPFRPLEAERAFTAAKERLAAWIEVGRLPGLMSIGKEAAGRATPKKARLKTAFRRPGQGRGKAKSKNGGL